MIKVHSLVWISKLIQANWKGIKGFCQMFFLCQLSWSCSVSLFFFINLLTWQITFVDIWMLNQSCIPGIGLIWSLRIFLLCILEFDLLKFCLGFLHTLWQIILFCSFLSKNNAFSVVFISEECSLYKMSCNIFFHFQFYERVCVEKSILFFYKFLLGLASESIPAWFTLSEFFF